MDAPLVTPTLDDPHTPGDLLGVTPGEALAVVVATILMYVAFLALQRLLGQRVFSGLSSVNITVAAVLGAIVGRATMGHTPTLAARMTVNARARNSFVRTHIRRSTLRASGQR